MIHIQISFLLVNQSSMEHYIKRIYVQQHIYTPSQSTHMLIIQSRITLAAFDNIKDIVIHIIMIHGFFRYKRILWFISWYIMSH